MSGRAQTEVSRRGVDAPADRGDTRPKHVRFAVLFACVAALLLTPRAAQAEHLWVAWESGEDADRCQDRVDDFFACMLGATNLNDLAVTYSSGHPLAFGDTRRVTGCQSSTTHWIDYDCVERQAQFPLEPHDVLLYFVPYPRDPIFGGFNEGMTLRIGDRDVPLSVAWAETRISVPDGGDVCSSTTRIGLHEVFEATTDRVSADCCGGGFFCSTCAASCAGWAMDAGMDPSFHTLVCGSGVFGTQAISPSTNEFDPSGCTAPTVDASALCGEPMASRRNGRCNAAGIERCERTDHVDDCGGAACVAAPVPHCDAPVVAHCSIHGPLALFTGAHGTVDIECVNDGTDAWPAGITLSLEAGSSSSPLQPIDGSWIDTDTVTAFDASPVAPGASTHATFRIDAPVVATATTITQRWSIAAPDGSRITTIPSDALITSVRVVPCAVGASEPDAGVDDAGGFDSTGALGRCHVAFPTQLCSGAYADVQGWCENIAAQEWPVNVRLVTWPLGTPSRLYSVGWIDDATVCDVSPTSTLPACSTRTFGFSISAPSPPDIHSRLDTQWAFVDANGSNAGLPPPFTVSIELDRCELFQDASPPRDAGVRDAARDAHADVFDASRIDAVSGTDASDESGGTTAGCRCDARSSAREHARNGRMVWVAAAMALYALARSRARGASNPRAPRVTDASTGVTSRS